MKRNRYELNKGRDIPLLEQEKINSISVGAKRRRYIANRLLKKASVTAVFSLFIILFIVVFIKSDFYRGNNFNTESTDKTPEVTGSDIDNTDTKNDVSAGVDIETEKGELSTEESKPPITFDELYKFDSSVVKDGEAAVIPMDLSLTQNGLLYINNSTGLLPNLESLLSKKFDSQEFELLSKTDAPRVLIIHTHSTEGYVDDGITSYKFDNEDFARTDDQNENVVSLGKIINDRLNKNGIKSIHCTVMHDSIQNKDSYSRSEDTIKEYLIKYPTIQLVIDIHRDSILTSGGDIVRPVTLVNNEAVAQVSCVVGSSWGGDRCDNWQDNLSVALKLRESLNRDYINFCRPVELRSQTYNQELSKYSLLINIGSCGNSVEEAQRSANLVAISLVKILKTIPF